MSQSVLKEALQLMQEDLNPTDVSTLQGKKRKTKNAMKLISTSRNGVWKELRRVQKQEQDRLKRKRDKKPDFKSAIEKYREEQLVRRVTEKPSTSSAEMNPSYLKNAKTVLEYHLKHQNRGKQTGETEEEESTVFTDRDFDKFEEEYDFFK
ncbi:hypothetical protein ACOMHN_025174 [Nucella lapillus]